MLQRGVREFPAAEPRMDEADGETPEAVAAEQERARALRAAVRRLPDRQRRLLTAMLDTPGASYEELSAALEMPTGSIRPTRERALGALRRDPCSPRWSARELRPAGGDEGRPGGPDRRRHRGAAGGVARGRARSRPRVAPVVPREQDQALNAYVAYVAAADRETVAAEMLRRYHESSSRSAPAARPDIDAAPPARVALAHRGARDPGHPELGAELADPGDDAADAARAILERLEQDELTLVPQGGPTEFFSVDVADKTTGEAVAADLREIDGVETAYVKPDIRPPG